MNRIIITSDRSVLHKFVKNKNVVLTTVLLCFKKNTASGELLHITKDKRINQTGAQRPDRENMGNMHYPQADTHGYGKGKRANVVEGQTHKQTREMWRDERESNDSGFRNLI